MFQLVEIFTEMVGSQPVIKGKTTASIGYKVVLFAGVGGRSGELVGSTEIRVQGLHFGMTYMGDKGKGPLEKILPLDSGEIIFT